jgi:hypothetical protein
MAAARPPQTYATHRNFPGYYFAVAAPLTLVALALAVWRVAKAPSFDSALALLTVLALAGTLGASRLMVLVVQNRIIRLEMRLRLREVLPAPLAARIPELTVGQLIGLRFASDAELPTLVERCLAGDLRSAESVKREVREWQPDTLRA